RARVRDEIVRPTLSSLSERGNPFVGFLYVGVMLTDGGPQLVEFNVRLGDPEAQCILPRLADGAFLELCARTARGELAGYRLEWDPRPVVAVVATAEGYPSAPRKGDPITIDPSLETPDRWLDQAGTRLDGERLVTHGGRVAAVVARGQTVSKARTSAYEGVKALCFDGMHHRDDIGA
ncbi:MAG: phosphoribosylglycinamide synthetase C domain-containing protein, partial [Myxococcota bacterium]